VAWEPDAPWDAALLYVDHDTPTGPLVVTAQPGNNPPRVLIELTASGWGSAYIYRLDPDLRYRAVRLAEPATISAGDFIGFDYEAPFGRPVTYIARSADDAGTGITSNTITLRVNEPWLRHPGVPSRSMRLATGGGSTVIRQFEPEHYATQRGVSYPIGRPRPIVLGGGARRAAESGLTVRVRTDQERQQLLDILADDSVLLLSVPPALGWGIEQDYVSVGDVDFQRITRWAANPARDVPLPYLVVDRPAGGLIAQWTCADVLAEFMTNQAVRNTFETCADLLTNTRGT
jgi:hypothetical protein